MVTETAQQADLREHRTSPRRIPMEMCPMATMCKGMIAKPPSGLAMFAGGVLIVLGMLVFVEPRIVIWLIGAAFVLVGIALLVLGSFLRRRGIQARNM